MSNQFLDRVPDLIDRLREADFNIGVDTYISTERLLLRLSADGTLPDDPSKLEPLLAPILSSVPSEQEEFGRYFREWLRTLPHEGRKEQGVRKEGDTIDQEARPVRPRLRPRRRLLRQLFLGLIAAITLATLFFLLFPLASEEEKPVDPSPAPDPIDTTFTEEPVDTSTVVTFTLGASRDLTDEEIERRLTDGMDRFYYRNYYLLRFGAPLFALGCIGLLVFLRNRRHMALERHYSSAPLATYLIPTSDEIARLYFGPEFRGLVRTLRRRRATAVLDLDVDHTVLRSVEKGGQLTLMYAGRKGAPEYLALVERSSTDDMSTRFIDVLLDDLVANGIYIDRYYYQRDPRVLTLASHHGTLSLRDLASLHPSHHLLLFGDGAGLISPVSGSPYRWSVQLEVWERRALLTPDHSLAWDGTLESLREQGYTVAAATPAGIAEAVDPDQTSFSVDTFHSSFSCGLPAVLKDDPDRWTSIVPPSENEIRSMWIGLLHYLGEDGFYWLAACAIYPVLQWEVLIYLGKRLLGNEAVARMLPSITMLPWFREGTMPDWFRRRLIDALPEDAEKKIREALAEMLGGGVDREGDIGLPVARGDRGGRAPIGDRARDYLYLGFMTRRRPNPLLLKIPERLRRFLFRNGRIRLGMRPGVVMGAAFIAAILIVTFMRSRPEAPAGRQPTAIVSPLAGKAGDTIEMKVQMLNRLTPDGDTFSLRPVRLYVLPVVDAVRQELDRVQQAGLFTIEPIAVDDTLLRARLIIDRRAPAGDVRMFLSLDSLDNVWFTFTVIGDSISPAPQDTSTSIRFLISKGIPAGDTGSITLESIDCTRRNLVGAELSLGRDSRGITLEPATEEKCRSTWRVVVSPYVRSGRHPVFALIKGDTVAKGMLRVLPIIADPPDSRFIDSLREVLLKDLGPRIDSTSWITSVSSVGSAAREIANAVALRRSLLSEHRRLLQLLDGIRADRSPNVGRNALLDSLRSLEIKLIRLELTLNELQFRKSLNFGCECDNGAYRNALDSLRNTAPTTAMIRSALCCFDESGSKTTLEEAARMLQHLGAEIEETGDVFVSGSLRSGYIVKIWINTYERSHCYGIRFGLPKSGFEKNNDTYLELCKKEPL